VNNGVPPLQQSMRDLAACARNLVPVLEALRAGCVAVDEIARKLRLEPEDVRAALYVLEDRGLATSTAYRLTTEGRRAA
jgi:transcription initiation factor IIE alpha subunit